MLRINRNTQIIEEPIIGIDISNIGENDSTYINLMNKLIKTANEVNRKMAGHTTNYITVSEEVVKELDKFKWDINRKY